MLQKVFRGIFALLGMLFGYGASTIIIDDIPGAKELLGEFAYPIFVPLVTALFGIIFYNLFSMFISRGEKVAKKVVSDIENIPSYEIATGTIGLVAGLFVAFLISQIINGIKVLQTAYINTILSVILYIALGYIGISLGRRAGVDVKTILSTRVSSPEKSAKRRGKSQGLSPKILDTSVIIDGRVVDILKTGFIQGDIVIPDFVLVELRHIADSADNLKRARGRRGLDILNKIQTDYGVDIYNTASEKSLDDIPEVDVKLIKLAEIIKGMVVTNDYNLNKVATVQGIGVLNINELASALKPVVLPGEGMSVFLVKEGKENDQAVAYLDDGTMIVVEGGRRFIGQTIRVTVSSVLQTSAGRMIFAKS